MATDSDTPALIIRATKTIRLPNADGEPRDALYVGFLDGTSVTMGARPDGKWDIAADVNRGEITDAQQAAGSMADAINELVGSEAAQAHGAGELTKDQLRDTDRLEGRQTWHVGAKLDGDQISNFAEMVAKDRCFAVSGEHAGEIRGAMVEFADSVMSSQARQSAPGRFSVALTKAAGFFRSSKGVDLPAGVEATPQRQV